MDMANKKGRHHVRYAFLAANGLFWVSSDLQYHYMDNLYVKTHICSY